MDRVSGGKTTGCQTSLPEEFAAQSHIPAVHCQRYYPDVNRASTGFPLRQFALVFGEVKSFVDDSSPCSRKCSYLGPPEAHCCRTITASLWRVSDDRDVWSGLL